MPDNTQLWSDEEWRAAMSVKDINDLPDSDFAYIEPGGEKDDDGKTVPRSLRHYPIHDEAHVRNALARAAAEIAHGDEEAADIARKAMPAIKAAAKKFGIDTGEEKSATVPATAIRADYRGTREERVSTRSGFQLREVPNGTGGTNLRFTGFACVTEATYEMEDWLGPWTESVSIGAFAKTLAEGADVAFFLNHSGMTLARTKPGTLKLAEEKDGPSSPVYGVTGLHSEALLDPQNLYVQAMRSAVDRGDLDEMSFAFRVMRQEWNSDYTRRWINEVSLDKGDVSLVNYGANPNTGGTVALRQRRGPLGLPTRELDRSALAFLAAMKELREGKKISAATGEVLRQVIGHHNDGTELLNSLLAPNDDTEPQEPIDDENDDGDDDGDDPGETSGTLSVDDSELEYRLAILRQKGWGGMTMTYGQIEDALQAAIRATLPEDDDDCWVYVCDFSETFVVYCQNGEYFQDDYSMDDEGNVTLAGSPVAVKPVTTYVGLGRGGEQTLRAVLEQRGLRVARTPPEIRTRAAAATAPRAQVASEPLTYRRDSVDARGNGVSYLRDLYMRHQDPAALERLTRHAVEMDDYRKRAAERATRAFERGAEEHGFEYRVNPNPTQGTGGYFTPPAWLVELAATYPRPRRVLAKLVNNFPLPPGASSVNIPVMLTGNTAGNQVPGTANDSSDVTDSSTSCNAVTISSMADVAIQFLEMGPVSGALDHAWFKDLSEAYDFNLETQLITGAGGTGPQAQFTGLVNVSNMNSVTYTDGSPTGHAMFPYFGQAAAAVGKKRGMPPFAWLMRTARWSWLVTSEDTSNRPLEFPDLNGADNALCPGAIAGWPVWMEDAIPTTLGTGGNQDTVIACIPGDLYLFEGQAVSHINVETLSGTLQARFTYRNYAAAITGRYASGISVLSGTGMIPVSGY